MDRGKALATVVYRWKEGKAVVTPVVVGRSDSTHTVIRSGLSETDRVVTGPYKALEKLRHGQEIEQERASAAATRPAATTASSPSTWT